MSVREEDLNGFFLVKGNPLSKVGVFPYLGAQISSELDPNKIYNVYRPEQELSSQECLKSFELLPFTDEHAMLGSSDEGLMPAERKGVHGVIGQDVYFEDGYLKGNLKVFSEKLSKLIEAGKKELSIGYRCIYKLVQGVYNGAPYDAIQTEIRGNHVALVDEGRAGHDVRVLDHFKFTLDSGVLKMEENEVIDDDAQSESKEDTQITALQSLASRLEELATQLAKITNSEHKPDEMKKDDMPAKEAKDDDIDDLLDGDDEDDDEEDGDGYDKKSGMDSKNFKKVILEISERDSLANRLSNHVGAFDSKSKTLAEVAAYGVKKLGIKCPKGHEKSVLEGYLLGKRAHTTDVKSASIGLDSKKSCSLIDNFISEGAKI